MKFLGLIFRGLTKLSILQLEDDLKIVITVNAYIAVLANRYIKLKNIINSNIATFDGQAPYILAKILNRNIKFEKISGSDLIFDLCELAKCDNKKIFLLGGYKQTNKDTVLLLKKKYNILVEGYSPDFSKYPFSEDHNNNIFEYIKIFKPHFLLVGFGCPKQEYWISDNKDKLKNIGVQIAVGVGGTFELVSRKFKRAPKWIQKIGFEWLYRFMQEPKRMWHRYTIGNIQFIILFLKEIVRKYV